MDAQGQAKHVTTPKEDFTIRGPLTWKSMVARGRAQCRRKEARTYTRKPFMRAPSARERSHKRKPSWKVTSRINKQLTHLSPMQAPLSLLDLSLDAYMRHLTGEHHL